jgi:MFS family permease
MTAANVPRFFVFAALVNTNLWLPVWVIFFQERGIGLAEIGAMDALSTLLMAFAEVATGGVADRFGRKTSMMIGAALHGLALIGLTTRVFSPVFVVGFLVWGASYTFISGADMAFLYDTLKADGRAEEHRWFVGRWLAVEHVCAGLAALAGGFLATIDMRYCFLVSGFSLMGAALVAATFTEPPRSEPGSADVVLRYREILGAAAGLVLRWPLIRYQVLFGAAATAFSFTLTWLLLQPYAHAMGVPTVGLGLMALLIRAASVVGSMTADRLARGVGTGAVVVAAAVILAGGQLALWAVASPTVLAVFVVVALASSVMRPTISALLNREIPSAQRATVLSIQSLLGWLAVALMEPLVLALGERVGMHAALGTSGLLTFACLFPLLAGWRRAAAQASAQPADGCVAA